MCQQVYTNLWSPCELNCMLSLKKRGDMIVIRFSEISVQKALQIAVKSHWDNTSHQVLHKLVFESMPARLHAVNKAKWGDDG